MSLKIYQFSLPFLHPLKTAKGLIDTREGIVIEVQFSGKSFWAEISPLPGFSISTMSDCEAWLRSHHSLFYSQFQKAINSVYPCTSIVDVVSQVADKSFDLLPQHTPTEIEYAFDSLLMEYISEISDLIHESPISVNINGTASSFESAVNLVECGYKSVKMKIGLDWNSEYQLISEFRSQFRDIGLRLDANEAWSVNDAKLFLNQIKPFNIDYIEQPISVDNLMEFGSQLSETGVSIAADESARSTEMIEALIKNHAASVFIIKPTLIGSFRRIRAICDLIKNSGHRIVFTSSIDTSLNYSISALLASIWVTEDEYHGFSTGSLLKFDISLFPPVISDSKILLEIKKITHPDTILNKKLLLRLL